MEFTEHELTAAVGAVARRHFEALPALLRRRAGSATWETLGKPARYPFLRTAGDLVLPALAALPERPTIGSVPQFTDEEYAAAAEAALRLDAGLSERKRRKATAAGVDLVRAAVAATPPRQDPDAPVVPDHL